MMGDQSGLRVRSMLGVDSIMEQESTLIYVDYVSIPYEEDTHTKAGGT